MLTSQIWKTAPYACESRVEEASDSFSLKVRSRLYRMPMGPVTTCFCTKDARQGLARGAVLGRDEAVAEASEAFYKVQRGCQVSLMWKISWDKQSIVVVK